MMDYADPYLLTFSKLGAADIGYISVSGMQPPPLPFEIKRVFWTYYTPESIVRGRHAHYNTEQVIVAAAGRIIVTTEQADGSLQTFRLEDPSVGLYVPPNCWHTMQYARSAVQLVFASTVFEEADYIRDYDLFQKVWQPTI